MKHHYYGFTVILVLLPPAICESTPPSICLAVPNKPGHQKARSINAAGRPILSNAGFPRYLAAGSSSLIR